MIEALSPSANCRGGGGKRGMDDMNMDTNDSHIYSTSFSKSPEGSMQKKNRRPLVMSSPFEHENLIPQLGTHVNQSNIGFAHSEKRMRFKDDSFGGGEEENAMIQIQRHIQSMQQYHESQMITVRMQNQQEMAKKDSQIDGLTKLSKQLLEANERLDHNCKVLTDENKILKRGVNAKPCCVFILTNCSLNLHLCITILLCYISNDS